MYICSMLIIVFGGIAVACGNVDLLGTIGVCVCVGLFASPLSTIRTVCAERSTASLPLGITASIWCNCVSWTAYGYYVADDSLIVIPNVLGVMLASMQLLLFGLFGLPPTLAKQGNEATKV